LFSSTSVPYQRCVLPGACPAPQCPRGEADNHPFPALWRQLAKDPEKTHLLGVGMAAILAELLQFWDENDTLICPRWTGPAPRFHPFGQVEPGLPSYSAQKAHAAPNRQDAIVDLPTFLPFRRPSARSER